MTSGIEKDLRTENCRVSTKWILEFGAGRMTRRLFNIRHNARTMRAFLFSTFDSTTREGEPLLDRIDLKSLQLYGFHGLGPGEKERGQRFIVDATLYLPLHRSGMSDNLHHTVNYVSVLR